MSKKKIKYYFVLFEGARNYTILSGHIITDYQHTGKKLEVIRCLSDLELRKHNIKS